MSHEQEQSATGDLMKAGFLAQSIPKPYGAATVGERGQAVIPAQAR